MLRFFCLINSLFLSLVGQIQYILAFVITASLANAVSKIVLAALRALNEICGGFQFPNAGTTFHFSRMRNLFLRNCHDYPPVTRKHTVFRVYLFF